MKKFLIITAAAVMASACACTSDKEKSGNSQKSNIIIETEAYSYSMISETSDTIPTDNPGGRYCRNIGRGVLPIKIGDNDISALRDSLISLAELQFPSSGVAEPRLENGWRPTQLPDSTEACGEEINLLAIVLNTPYIVVWQDYRGEYACGAAHGMYETRYVNYSITAGKILTLADIFRRGYEKDLTALLRERLADNSDINTDPDSIGIPSQFRVTTEGITFVYGVYQIAPFSAGEITVAFNTYELDGLLTPAGKSLIAGYGF